MKKIMLFAATVIIVFCIIPFTTTQAMPQQIQTKNSLAPNDLLYVLNQKEPHNIGMVTNNSVPENNARKYDIQMLHGKTMPNNNLLMAGRAHVHTGQLDHLKEPEPAPYIVDDEDKDDLDNDDADEELDNGVDDGKRSGQLDHLKEPEPAPYIVDDEYEEQD